jgi:hypothetical protein
MCLPVLQKHKHKNKRNKHMPVINRKDIQSQVAKKLDMQTELPKKRYTLLCKKESFGISKNSKQPMVTREWEIVAPEKLEINGIMTTIAGTELTQYLPLGANANPAKSLTAEQATANAVERYLSENGKLGLDSETVNTDNPTLSAEGKVVEAICNSRATSPTESDGTPIYDPQTDKPIVRYQPNLVEILGISKTQVNTAF